MKKFTFSDEWKYWIWDNIKNGITKKDIFGALLKQGWDHDAIKQELNFDLSKPSVKHSPIPFSPDKPRLKVKGSVKIDTDKLDLYCIDNFLKKKECEKLITVSEEFYKPSLLARDHGDPEFRTSSTCHIGHMKEGNSKSYAQHIQRKIIDRLGEDPVKSEPLQFQRYEVGQEFKPHTDFFKEAGGEHQEYVVETGYGQRTYTFMVFLNNVEEGGSTFFPKIDRHFFPKRGQALIWDNMSRDGTPNRNTEHAGTPIIKGKKYIISAWFRENSCQPDDYFKINPR